MPKAVIVASLVLLGWLFGGTWWWVCKHRGLCVDQTASISAPSVSTPELSGELSTTLSSKRPTFSIDYQGKPWYQISDHLRFGKSNPTGFIPGSIRTGIDSLASYLKTNPTKDLEITGLYAEDEENTSDKLNLGLGRASFFLQQLLDRGVSADRFIQLPQQLSLSDLFGEEDTLFGGISLRLLDRNSGQIADANARLTEGETASEEAPPAPEISFEPRNFLFELAKSDMILSQDDRTYISGVIQYLRQNPDKKLQLTGHADNTGTSAKNMEYGWGRANTVKQFFTSFGLNATQITTDSKGDRDPAQSNATAEGRRQNRRVEVRISN